MGDIVRRTDPDFRIVECFGAGPPSCRLHGSCILTSAVGEALAAFLEVLDGYTLADLIRPKRKLCQLLDLTARSEEHTSELQSLMRITYAGFGLKKKTNY